MKTVEKWRVACCHQAERDGGGVAGGCLTQPPGEEKMEVRRRRWPARTHQKSFTQGAREDWYGRV